MRPDIVVGATFPDFELSDHLGRTRRLSRLQGPDPLVRPVSELIAERADPSSDV